MAAVAAECDHDHDGYATGYQDALDYVFEYVEHLAMNATGCRIRADELGQKFSKAHYMGEEAVLKRLLEWISEEDEDDDGGGELKRIAGGGQGVPAGGVAAGGDLRRKGEPGAGAAVSADEAPDGGGTGGLGDS